MSDYQPSIGMSPPRSPPMPGQGGLMFTVAPAQNVQQNLQPVITNGPTFQVAQQQQPTFQVAQQQPTFQVAQQQQPTFQVAQQQPTFHFAQNAAHVPVPTVQPVPGNILKLDVYTNKSFIVRGVQDSEVTRGYAAALKAAASNSGTFIRNIRQGTDLTPGWCFQNRHFEAVKAVVEGANNGTIQPQVEMAYQPQGYQQNYQQQTVNPYAHLYQQQQTQQQPAAINFNLNPSPAVSLPVTPAPTTTTNPNQQIVSWTMRKPVVNDKVILVYEDGSAGEEYTVEIVETDNNIVISATLDPGHDCNKKIVIINGQWQIREDNNPHTLQFK